MNKSYEDVVINERGPSVDGSSTTNNRGTRAGAIEGIETRKNMRSKSIYHSVMPAGESPEILIIENIESLQANKRSNKNESYNVGDTATVINKPAH
jgi:hypothetical protein